MSVRPSGSWAMPPEQPTSHPTIVRWLAGLPICGLLAYGTTRLIGEAWSACGDNEPPYMFGLVFGVLPAMAVVMFVVWTLWTALTRGRPWPIFAVPVATALLLVGWFFFAATVPMNEPDYYNAPASLGDPSPFTSACGRDGIPTWWPSWLPT